MFDLLKQLLRPQVGSVNVDVSDISLASDLVQLLVLSLYLTSHFLRHRLQVRQH